jgi:multisubunit Na+/H+ antiporter MnhG subunit
MIARRLVVAVVAGAVLMVVAAVGTVRAPQYVAAYQAETASEGR